MLAQANYNELLELLKKDLSVTFQSKAMLNLGHWPAWVGLGVVALCVIAFIFGCFYVVSTQEVAIVERFSKFQRKRGAGLRFKLPLIETVPYRLSLMLEQHSVKFSSITKDKVTVTVHATIQYKVIPDREYDAYYLLDDPDDQIENFFFDIMRSSVPVMTLDELYATKDSISVAATVELEKDMTQFGYVVPRVLITGIDPDDKVKAAMNDINAAQREAQAASARGDAAKIIKVKEAEAQAEADKLRGKGIADQRTEIARGLKDSVTEIKGSVPTAHDDQILALLLMTQYTEMIEKVAASGKTNTILLPHSPGGMADVRQQIIEAMAIKSNQ